MLLAIASIRTDGGTQPRGAVDYSVVESYQDAMETGAKFPAVDVFYDGTAYWLADGFHRVQASFQTGRDEIECVVHQGTLEDAQWFSYGANKTNGLYRSNADKQRAVQAALKHPKSAQLSDGQIAKHCGVSVNTVGNWRGKLTLKISESPLIRHGADGRTINTANIGKRPESAKEPVRVEPLPISLTFSVPVELITELEPAPPIETPQPEPALVDYAELNRVCAAISALATSPASPYELAEFINNPQWVTAVESAEGFLKEVTAAWRKGTRKA